MKRDIEKIRNIMLYLEENLEPNKEICSTDLPFYDKLDDNDYLIMKEHITLLVESNLVEEHNVTLKGFKIFYFRRITNKGYDFLDALRNDNVWNEVKDKTVKAGGYTLSFLVELGKDYIKSELLK